MYFGLHEPLWTSFDPRYWFPDVKKDTPETATLTLHAFNWLKDANPSNCIFVNFRELIFQVFVYPPSCLTIFLGAPIGLPHWWVMESVRALKQK